MTSGTPLTAAPAPRLPLVGEATDPEVAALFDGILARSGRLLNLHRMMAHAPSLMKASVDTAMAMRHGTLLPRSLIEIVILRTALLLRSDYEWQQHRPMAVANGVSPQQIDALTDWPASTLFADDQREALAFCDCIVGGTAPEDAAFRRLRQHFSPREIVELALIVCHYLATAHFVAALALPLELGAGEAAAMPTAEPA